MKNSLKFGVLLGFMMIVVSIIEYFIAPISVGYLLQNFVIFMILSSIIIFFAIKHFKEKNNGFASYGESLKIIFPILLTFILVWTAYNYVFHAILFPDFFHSHKAEYVEWSKDLRSNSLKLLGTSGFEYEEEMLKVEEEIELEFHTVNDEYVTLSGISESIFGKISMMLLLSLILSIFYKRNPPINLNN